MIDENKVTNACLMLKFLRPGNKAFSANGLQFLKDEIGDNDFELKGAKVEINVPEPATKEIKVDLNSVTVKYDSGTESGGYEKKFVNCLGNIDELKKTDGIFIRESVTQIHGDSFENFFINCSGETIEETIYEDEQEEIDKFLKLGEECDKQVIIDSTEYTPA